MGQITCNVFNRLHMQVGLSRDCLDQNSNGKKFNQLVFSLRFFLEIFLSGSSTIIMETPVATDRTPLLPESHGHLRRVADSLPLSVWLIATIELCERFAYYGIAGPMQNYIQNSRHDPLVPGGIGKLAM